MRKPLFFIAQKNEPWSAHRSKATRGLSIFCKGGPSDFEILSCRMQEFSKAGRSKEG